MSSLATITCPLVVNPFPVLSPCMTYHRGFVTILTRRVPLMEQELLTLPGHTSSPPVFMWGSCCSISNCLCSVFCFVDHSLSFFCLVIKLSVLRFTVSDYPFGIFRLLLNYDRLVVTILFIVIYLIYPDCDTSLRNCVAK